MTPAARGAAAVDGHAAGTRARRRLYAGSHLWCGRLPHRLVQLQRGLPHHEHLHAAGASHVASDYHFYCPRLSALRCRPHAEVSLHVIFSYMYIESYHLRMLCHVFSKQSRSRNRCLCWCSFTAAVSSRAPVSPYPATFRRRTASSR